MLTAQDIASLVAARWAGWSLEQPFYTDPSIFALDLECVFRRYWLFAGHSLQLPNAGDYITLGIDGDSLILVRGDDGQVRAFFNVCRHRGSVICTEPSGHAGKLVCPYHQWVYDRDGTLLAAKFMPEEFDRYGFGLHAAPVREVGGLIFVSLSEEPPDFEPVERDFAPYLAPYRLPEAKVCATREYDVRANWKLITENFRECYHCTVGHPQYCRAVIGASPHEGLENGAECRAVRAERMSEWQAQGLETRNVAFSETTWHHCSRYPFRPGYVSESMDGQPVAPVMGDLPARDTGIFAVVMYPNFWLEASSDYVWTMRTTPLTPTATRVDLTWLVRGDAVEGADYDVDRVTAFWRVTGEQDWQLCEQNQAGINSTRYRPGPYALVESDIEKFLRWYLAQFAGPRA